MEPHTCKIEPNKTRAQDKELASCRNMVRLGDLLSRSSSLVLLYILLVVKLPSQVLGSSRGIFHGALFNGTLVDAAVNAGGICADSVIPHGYKCIEHEVKTEDGYILSMQRIPSGRGGSPSGTTNKQPVLIQHGVLVDGKTWFLNPPNENLPFILADNGYDVWIANSRGTRYSQKHVTLSSKSPEYWNWSWDEMVIYDLPATFGLVHSQTGQKIHYIGHSLGTLIGLASFSEGRQVDKLKSAALLCPVAYLSHMTTALGTVAARTFVGEMTTVFGLAEFNPKGKEVANFLNRLCHIPGVNCYNYLTALTGKNCCLNSTTVDLFLQSEPQSTSTKNMVHLAQTARDGVLTKFNYGRSDYNVQHYGDSKPPVYNISNIPHDLPIFVSYGGHDALSDTQDVGTLLDLLKFHDLDKLSVQFIKDYAHADFIMGVSAKDLVYAPMVKFFNQQS